MKTGNDLRRDAYIADITAIIDFKLTGGRTDFSIERAEELERNTWALYATVPI